jgi:hypothetical protein
MISRALAVSLLLVLLPAWPAAAAPPAATAEPHVQPVTLAPGGPSRNTLLSVRTRNVEPGTKARVEVTVDLGGVSAFADVRVGPGVPARETRTCRRTEEKILCSWTAALEPFEFPAVLTVSPRTTAKVGDTAELAMSARVGDGAVGAGTTVIQVGEGPGLTAGQDRKVEAVPGRSVTFTPVVRNDGSTKIDGAVLVFPVNTRLLGPSSYRNCRYGLGLICTFDTELLPGRRYALAKPVTLRTPIDTVPGSAVQLVEQWITKAQWADADHGTAGTGAPLALQSLSATAKAPPHDDFATTTLTVTGKRRPTLTAVGVRRDAAVGDEVTLSPGLVNFGPGTLRPGLFPNNALAVAAGLPENVVAGDSGACSPSTGLHYCVLDEDLGPGDQATFPIGVQVASACGEPGRVEVRDELSGKSGSVAKLSIDVPGSTCHTGAASALPITGPGAGLTGLLLIVAGLLAVVGVRRPVCAHAGRERGPDHLRKDTR